MVPRTRTGEEHLEVAVSELNAGTVSQQAEGLFLAESKLSRNAL